jgi:hypothetical protein
MNRKHQLLVKAGSKAHLSNGVYFKRSLKKWSGRQPGKSSKALEYGY